MHRKRCVIILAVLLIDCLPASICRTGCGDTVWDRYAARRFRVFVGAKIQT